MTNAQPKNSNNHSISSHLAVVALEVEVHALAEARLAQHRLVQAHHLRACKLGWKDGEKTCNSGTEVECGLAQNRLVQAHHLGTCRWQIVQGTMLGWC